MPPTRWFAFKARVLRLLGVQVGHQTKICGDVKFYGGGRISIGSHCWIGIGARFYTSPGADVIIGDRCDIAPQVSFMCGTHDIGDADRRAGSGRSERISVGCGSWVGFGSTLLGGCSVGRSSIVAARSLLLGRAYRADSLLVGSPCQIKRSLEGETGNNDG